MFVCSEQLRVRPVVSLVPSRCILKDLSLEMYRVPENFTLWACDFGVVSHWCCCFLELFRPVFGCSFACWVMTMLAACFYPSIACVLSFPSLLSIVCLGPPIFWAPAAPAGLAGGRVGPLHHVPEQPQQDFGHAVLQAEVGNGGERFDWYGSAPLIITPCEGTYLYMYIKYIITRTTHTPRHLGQHHQMIFLGTDKKLKEKAGW